MGVVDCGTHGRSDVSFVCTHVAHATLSGADVGFFWNDATETARPDAWCAACEQTLVALAPDASLEEWTRACDFKVFCVGCWDAARAQLYRPSVEAIATADTDAVNATPMVKARSRTADFFRRLSMAARRFIGGSRASE